MLKQRILVALILIPLGVAAIIQGGWVFGILLAILLGLAVWEYAALFRAGGLEPAGFLMVAGVVAFIFARLYFGTKVDALLITAAALLLMAVHERAFEKGRQQAGSDFAVSLSGFIYIGLLGSYFPLLRALPDGQWWLLVVLPAVWLADSGAFFLGTKFGKHKMVPRLSPKKSWEGYAGGIIMSLVFTPLLLLWYRSLGLPPGSSITPAAAAVIGLVMGIFPTLGDLGESMIKRQVGVKDSGTLLPGHGGLFDRVDSMLWAGPIAYYLITWLFI
ncbi:MAG: phosphatidate cytidylyltransferase [Anaerolineae bacterium]|nr:phosphatidate cytidylyltransferase [Anaerolineae bacterium]